MSRRQIGATLTERGIRTAREAGPTRSPRSRVCTASIMNMHSMGLYSDSLLCETLTSQGGHTLGTKPLERAAYDYHETQ